MQRSMLLCLCVACLSCGSRTESGTESVNAARETADEPEADALNEEPPPPEPSEGQRQADDEPASDAATDGEEHTAAPGEGDGQKTPPPNVGVPALAPPDTDAVPNDEADAGGAPTVPPGDAVVPPPSVEAPSSLLPSTDPCWFEFLGYGVRCQESFVPPLDVHMSLSECAQACLEQDDCTSIADHTYFDIGLNCSVHTGPCTVDTDAVYEEDGGREYVKVCGDTPPDDATTEFSDAPGFPGSFNSACRFVPLDDYVTCEGTVSAELAEETHDSLEACTAACEANSECSAVMDWWLAGPTEFECALHLGSCDSPEPYDLDHGTARTFVKQCPDR